MRKFVNYCYLIGSIIVLSTFILMIIEDASLEIGESLPTEKVKPYVIALTAGLFFYALGLIKSNKP